MIRFICLNAFITVYSILFSLWGILLSVFDTSGRIVHFYTAVPWAKGILRVSGVKVVVRGQENVDRTQARIYLTNHMSYFDIFVLLAGLPVDFKFILKQELMRIPIFGPAMRKAGYIGIDRKDPRKAIQGMNEAVTRIKAGASVLLFPEGTRSEDGKLQPFKSGGFHLALKSGCDIIPVAIVNSNHIVPKGSLRINKGTVTLTIGKPIPLRDYTKRDVDALKERVREAILNQMNGA